MNISRLLIFFFLLISVNAMATHNRAGQITYKFIGVLLPQPVWKYEVTITTFTKTSSVAADRPQLDSVYWGDGTGPQVFYRDSAILLPNDIKKNIYTEEHTYNGNGEYLIHFTDPNRNANVRNIPNSVAVPFYLETKLWINPFRGANNSVITGYDPIDEGCVNRIFVHNPAAFDKDGDSLSYQLIECRGDNGDPIGGYSFPSANVAFTLDNDGYLTWNTPQDPGEYNVAFMIIEWRNGDTIGFVVRDMQILIGNCDNFPPIITVISDTCVLAGDTLNFNVFARDPDFNRVELSASGAVFDPSLVPFPATFTDSIVNNDSVISKFKWITRCSHVRPQPYFAQFRAKDLPSAGIPSLVDLKGTYITVIAPGPDTLYAVPNSSSIDLTWPVPFCSGPLKYNIYRRVGPSPNEIECPCTNGVPASTGYVLIGTTDGSDTTFTDDNNGAGLTIGIQYCYIVTAVYDNGSESCASPQSCASLKKDAPVITNADVMETSTTTGKVYVAWSMPTELDMTAFPGPYKYKLLHSPDFAGSNFTEVATFNNLTDTIFIDSLINTKDQPWSYKILFYYTHPGVGDSLKGNTAIATTIYLKISPTDNKLNLTWEEHVPWTNQRYDIFKQNASLLFDSIASVTTQAFSDTGLINGTEYCYYIRSSGSYSFSGFIDPIINRSQIECGIPVDNVPPCATELTVTPDCNESQNELRWVNPNNICSDDVLKYYIYFGATETGNFELIDSVVNTTDTVYLHSGLSMISGCYKVTAVDSVGNETLDPVVVCIDTCRQYVLPSVFTPDGDGKNDFFHPCDSTTSLEYQATTCPPYKNVKEIDMKIYNRWGNLVFETKNRDINWDGKNKDTNADCSEGVYYYTCTVYFFTTKMEQSVDLKGTIQLIRNK